MIYALNAEGLSYGDEADGVLEFTDEVAAEDAFREYVTKYQNRPNSTSILECYLFSTREEAESANQSSETDVLVDDAKAFRTLDWERGFGFNF